MPLSTYRHLLQTTTGLRHPTRHALSACYFHRTLLPTQNAQYLCEQSKNRRAIDLEQIPGHVKRQYCECRRRCRCSCRPLPLLASTQATSNWKMIYVYESVRLPPKVCKNINILLATYVNCVFHYSGSQMAITDENKSAIESVTKAWTEKFNSRDVAGICALYDSEAVLWGTLSPTVCATPQDVRQYFDKAFTSPMVVTVTFDEQLIRVCGDTMLNTGSYTLAFLRDGKQQLFPARFSMTFRNQDNRWLIVDHHSSARPSAT